MTSAPDPTTDVRTEEVRLLDGPNLYFTRPAVKVSLVLPGYLQADEARMRQVASRLRLRGVEPGEPGTAARQRLILRIVERALRSLARSAGTTHLGVRARPGSRPDEVVVAFPWHSRERGEGLGEALGPVLSGLLRRPDALDDLVAEWATPLRALPTARAPRMRPATVPVIAITGTNGKTTTTRLVAHIGMTAGLRTGWSSTDGILVQGELVEEGDYSGPSGARHVLESPGVQLGVLETARGGMLLRGLGLPSYDVSVVTNVSADHLGQNGIDTLDELAEVKAIITRVTRPTGWVVLNGDDPRVWAMRYAASGQPWCFSLHPDAPSLRESLQRGGRGMTILDGDLVVLRPGADPEHLLPVADIPMTLAGLALHNVANAMAGAAGALGLGLPTEAVVEGLRTFMPDHVQSPGRMNIYTVPVVGGDCTVILDMAHNVEGLESLLRVADGLRTGDGRLLLGLGTGGDRQDEIIQDLGEVAGLHADLVRIQHKEKYLRGRDRAEMTALFEDGLARVGASSVGVHQTELEGLEALLDDAAPGDVIAYMTHQFWALLHAHLLQAGARPDEPEDIRRKAGAPSRAHQPRAGGVSRETVHAALDRLAAGDSAAAADLLRGGLDA